MAVQANLRYPDSVARAAERSDVLINLVGILQETGSQSFARLQVEGADAIARAAARQGARMIHVSAIGADSASPSLYARTKAEGEARVFSACPNAVVFRPSLIFGPGDGFFNRFASLARALPVLPLAGGQSRFQPAFVGRRRRGDRPRGRRDRGRAARSTSSAAPRWARWSISCATC